MQGVRRRNVGDKAARVTRQESKGWLQSQCMRQTERSQGNNSPVIRAIASVLQSIAAKLLIYIYAEDFKLKLQN